MSRDFDRARDSINAVVEAHRYFLALTPLMSEGGVPFADDALYKLRSRCDEMLKSIRVHIDKAAKRIRKDDAS